jgi:hypothetical protein
MVNSEKSNAWYDLLKLLHGKHSYNFPSFANFFLVFFLSVEFILKNILIVANLNVSQRYNFLWLPLTVHYPTKLWEKNYRV